MIKKQLFYLLLFLLFSKGSFGGSPDIDWELVRPFKFLTDEKIYSTIKDEYNSLSNSEKLYYPSLAVESKLHQAKFKGKKYVTNGWITSIAISGYSGTCWNVKSARYKTTGNCSNYIHPSSHDITVWLKNNPYSKDMKCEWRYGANKAISHCNKPIVIKNIPYPEGLDINVTPLVKGLHSSYSTNIKVVDKLIVGIGDSYASGEGNPDIPVNFSEQRANRDIFFTKNWFTPRKNEGNYAIWADRRCHRSLYSYQFKTALLMSLENPKQAITFLSYSCSGAKVDHILSKWKGATENYLFKQEQKWISTGLGFEQKWHNRYKEIAPQLYSLSNDIKCHDKWRGNCKKGMREIDFVLLSIGGNDIGFAKYVKNIALSKENKLSLLNRKIKARKVEKSLEELLNSYKELYHALSSRLPIKQCVISGECERVLLTTYPNILNDENGKLCSDDKGAFQIPFGTDDNRGSRIKEVFEKVILPLQDMQYSLPDHGIKWSIVNSHNESYRNHGICSINSSNNNIANETLIIPHKKDISEPKWRSFSPNEYRGYGKMQRWVRLPVDSKLLMNMTRGGRDFFFSDESSGIVHPNTYGHSSTADANLKLIRAIDKNMERAADTLFRVEQAQASY
ncbi:hypothetical protein L4D08_24440 [Photobacterium chitinilyticum]|uniref:hypothetical protein n=1 Tax=Photobacterium chitinilyticum TaxID=2485123 RepID=UPI003D144527